MIGESCIATAPCSTANLGPGYDVFGLALDALEDKVKISRRISPSAGGKININNSDQSIPSKAESNSAGLVVKKMMQDFEISDSIEIEIIKVCHQAMVLAAVLLRQQLLR